MLAALLCLLAAEPVDVFTAGDGYPTYRIPSLVNAGGTPVAFAEGRQSVLDHAGNDLVARRSEDGGRTWGDLIVVAAEEGDLSLNNPQAVVLPDDSPHPGRILLHYQRSAAAEREVQPGFEGDLVARTFQRHSDDAGRTWSDAREITRQVKRDTPVTTSASGPGIGIVLSKGPHAGRILMPFNQGPYNEWRTYVAYSDDWGGTWTMGGLAPEPVGGLNGSHANEVQVAERPDGSVLMNARSQPGATRRLQCVSEDGGETWSPLAFHETLVSPTCQASLLRLSDGRLAFCNPASEKGRKNGVLRVSDDGGDTWSDGVGIHDGGFAYSCMAELPGGRVGVLYERDGYKAITFRAVDVPQ